MIKQDNRPNTIDKELEKKIRILKNLLDDAPDAGTEEKNVPKEKYALPPDHERKAEALLHEKPPVITISGDNNIVSTGESKVVILNDTKKSRLLRIAVFCVLFF